MDDNGSITRKCLRTVPCVRIGVTAEPTRQSRCENDRVSGAVAARVFDHSLHVGTNATTSVKSASGARPVVSRRFDKSYRLPVVEIAISVTMKIGDLQCRSVVSAAALSRS